MSTPLTIEGARKLSPEEINRIIAIATGWTEGEKAWWSPPGKEGTGDDPYPPDYFHDLNACFEAVNQLNQKSLEVHDWGVLILEQCLLDDLRTPRKKGLNAYNSPANIRAIALAVVLSSRNQPKG